MQLCIFHVNIRRVQWNSIVVERVNQTIAVSYTHLRQSREVSYQMICVYREDGQLSENYASLGISMYKLTPRKGFDFAYLRSLRKYFLSQHVDIVHAQHPLEACYAWLACLGTKIKIVQSFHGYDFHQTRKGHLILEWMIHRVDLNIFVSETQKRYYVRKYGLCLSLIHISAGKIMARKM